LTHERREIRENRVSACCKTPPKFANRLPNTAANFAAGLQITLQIWSGYWRARCLLFSFFTTILFFVVLLSAVLFAVLYSAGALISNFSSSLTTSSFCPFLCIPPIFHNLFSFNSPQQSLISTGFSPKKAIKYTSKG